MANLNLNQVKMDEILFQSKKRVRLSDFSDHSDRKHRKISTADLSDDEIMNESFCESVFEDDNDDNSEQELHSNEKLLSNLDSPENKRTLYENLKSFSIEYAIKYALDSELVKSLPKSVHETSIFAVDLNVFNLKDLLADDNGAYQEYGNKRKYYKFTNSFDIMSCKSKPLIVDQNVYLVQKRFYKSKANKSFIKKTYTITRVCNKKDYNKIVIAYFWEHDLEQSLDLKVHGNSKFTNKPYIRSSGTLINEIKKQSSLKGSSERKYNNMHDNIELHSTPLSDIPRNVKQISQL